MTDPYQLLGVSPDASEEEVTKAYRALARRYHPDIHPNDKEAERKMKDINAAYEQIKNIKSGKAQYSRQTGYTEAPQGAGRARRFLWFGPFGPLLRLLRVWKRANRQSTGRSRRFSFGRLLLLIILLRIVLSLFYSCFYSPYPYGYPYYSAGQSADSAEFTEIYTQGM